MEGYVLTYNQEKGIGTIVSEKERFWFHRDRIAKGPVDPEINDRVVFDILDKPILPGKLRVATHIVVLEIGTGINALGQKDSTTEAN
jgi:cold shock CspA family protein